VIHVADVDVDGLERLVAVHNTLTPDDPASVESFVDWRRQADDMAWLVAEDAGKDVGAGIGIVGWHSRPGTAFVEAWTLPEGRGRGVGLALYRELLHWAGERGCIAVETAVAENDAASIAWAEHRGFREVGRNSRLVLALDDVEAPDVDPPAGIEITSWADRPGIERGLYDVYVEAEPDIPGEEGNEVAAFEAWLANDMQGASDSAEATFVALAGDEVVGFAKLSMFAEQTDVAFHDLTGVKRAWRGRGIAGALKRAQIAWAKERGYRKLVTNNEERNEPIRRLNERHGYRVEPGRVIMRTAISGPD
jgi:RimJ/RimL family protein N-acetyltransferase